MSDSELSDSEILVAVRDSIEYDLMDDLYFICMDFLRHHSKDKNMTQEDIERMNSKVAEITQVRVDHSIYI